MKDPKTIRSLFSQAGFVAKAVLGGVMGDRYARVIRLKRRKKRAYARSAGDAVDGGTTSRYIAHAICQWGVGGSISSLRDGESGVRGVGPCL